jgi:hypothetical protein
MNSRRATNLVKVENDNVLSDTHNILNRWKHFFSQLLNVNGINDERQTEIHTAEPLVPEPSFCRLRLLLES